MGTPAQGKFCLLAMAATCRPHIAVQRLSLGRPPSVTEIIQPEARKMDMVRRELADVSGRAAAFRDLGSSYPTGTTYRTQEDSTVHKLKVGARYRPD